MSDFPVDALRLGGATGPRQSVGVVRPEGAVIGSPGDIYINTGGGYGYTVWVKQTGVVDNVGWTNVGVPVCPGLVKDLVDNVDTPLFQIDMNNTINPPGVVDNTFSARVFFIADCSDGVNNQTRMGDVQAAVAYKPSTLAYDTVQTLVSNNAALTGGTLAVTPTWATLGTVATFRLRLNTSLVPTVLKLHYFLLATSHDTFSYL